MKVRFSRNPDATREDPNAPQWVVPNVRCIVWEHTRPPQNLPLVGFHPGGDAGVEAYVPVTWSRSRVVLSDAGSDEVEVAICPK